MGKGPGVKPAPKPSLDRWGCACKISSRSVQGFGFQLALHIPTDHKQTSVSPFFYLKILKFIWEQPLNEKLHI